VSISPIATLYGYTFVPKKVPASKELAEKLLSPPGNVGKKDFEEYAVSPLALFVTVIGLKDAPLGTTTVNELEEAPETTALTAPK